jgi:hypothetical protein
MCTTLNEVRGDRRKDFSFGLDSCCENHETGIEGKQAPFWIQNFYFAELVDIVGKLWHTKFQVNITISLRYFGVFKKSAFPNFTVTFDLVKIMTILPRHLSFVDTKNH